MANKVIEIKPSKIRKWDAGTSVVLALKESLTYQNCEEIEEKFNECIDQHKTRIILDCKELSFIDSKGLELLVRTKERLNKKGGSFKVVGLNAVCRDIFHATRLVNMFYLYKDIREAIRSGQ